MNDILAAITIASVLLLPAPGHADTVAQNLFIFSCKDGEQVLVVHRYGDGQAFMRTNAAPFPSEDSSKPIEIAKYEGWESPPGSFFFKQEDGFARLVDNTLMTVHAGGEEELVCARRDNELFFERVIHLTGLETTSAERLAVATAAAELRERLRAASTELTTMTLALEKKRKEAEDTLTLLAAARAAQADLDDRLAEALLAKTELEGTLADREAALAQALAEVEALQAVGDEAELRQRLASALAAKTAVETAGETALIRAEEMEILLANANRELTAKDQISAEAQRREELLNQQVVQLRAQLGSLQALLDAAIEADAEAQVEIKTLGSQLNVALAKVAAEQRARAEAERKQLEQCLAGRQRQCSSRD